MVYFKPCDGLCFITLKMLFSLMCVQKRNTFSVFSSPLLFFISLFGLVSTPYTVSCPTAIVLSLHWSFVLSFCLTSAPNSHDSFFTFVSASSSFFLSSVCILWSFAMHDTLSNFLLIFLIFVTHLHIHAVIFLPGCISIIQNQSMFVSCETLLY